MTPSENVSDFCSVVSNSSGGNSALNGLYAANIDSIQQVLQFNRSQDSEK